MSHISKCIRLITYPRSFSKNISSSLTPIPPHLSAYFQSRQLKDWTLPLFPSMILNFKIKRYCWRKSLKSMKKGITNRMKPFFVFQWFIFTTREAHKLSLRTQRTKSQKALRIKSFITRCQTLPTIRTRITIFSISKQQSRVKSEWFLVSAISSRSRWLKSIGRKTSNLHGRIFKKPSV